MQESSLHAALKDWYTLPGSRQEAWIDGYLVDVARDDLLIEIQTRNFTAIRPKLVALLENHAVRLVHPIAQQKWIVRLPTSASEPASRRKSPRLGRLEHVFIELVHIPSLVLHPNFTLEVLLTRQEEIRREDGRGSWRRKGVSILDHRLIEITAHHLLSGPDDFRVLLPAGLSQPFTNRDLAAALHIPNSLAIKMTYCLRALDILEITGKQGRALLYANAPRAYNSNQ